MPAHTWSKPALAAAIMLYPFVASAGPCSDDIAALGKQLSGSPALGAVTSGTLSGSNPGTAPTSTKIGTKGTTDSNNGKLGGTAGTKELDAASSSVATSPDDVRRQQEGKPTTEQAAAAGSQSVETSKSDSNGNKATASDDRVSRAKMEWQKAVALNAKNDSSCKNAVKEAQDTLRAG